MNIIYKRSNLFKLKKELKYYPIFKYSIYILDKKRIYFIALKFIFNNKRVLYCYILNIKVLKVVCLQFP